MGSMRAILWEPHHDDSVLFATYTLLREKPTVITVFSHPSVERQVESMKAMDVVECNYGMVGAYEGDAGAEALLLSRMIREHDLGGDKKVFAPAVEEDGHADHNLVGSLAGKVFGPENVTHYMTYRRGHGRSRSDNEVEPEPGWRALKMQAMACYASQIERDDTRPWFCGDDVFREWIQ